MSDNTDHIVEKLKRQITEFDEDIKVDNVGDITTVGDGVVWANGLSHVMAGEIIELEAGNESDDNTSTTEGVALTLNEHEVGIIILGDWEHLREGGTAKRTGRILSIPTGDDIVGRVVTPLGEPADGEGAVNTEARYPLEKIAPGVITRQEVDTPLQTGIKSIDSMIPIGRGQRELIIGDRQVGKSAIAIDTIINQRDEDVICIYVPIGQKEAEVAAARAKLEEAGAMEYTIIVAANASDPAAMRYAAPYAGCAIGEYFMDQGKDALIIYDDLSKHADSYRELALVLGRPPGREAYPGDIFYLHSRLLERACRLHEDYGGGSLTALPIVETQAGDVSAYIPTNVISITDGQIYLETDLFYKGIRPALNVGRSVSRVGSSAQIKAMKKVAGKLRLDLAQYRELEAFAQFSSDLDEETQKRLGQGRAMTELLKQWQYSPMPVEQQIAVLYCGTQGYLADIETGRIREFEQGLLQYLQTQRSDVLEAIRTEQDLTEEIETQLSEAIEEYKKTFTGSRQP